MDNKSDASISITKGRIISELLLIQKSIVNSFGFAYALKFKLYLKWCFIIIIIIWSYFPCYTFSNLQENVEVSLLEFSSLTL